MLHALKPHSVDRIFHMFTFEQIYLWTIQHITSEELRVSILLKFSSGIIAEHSTRLPRSIPRSQIIVTSS
jgi:hypothetical protein